MSEGWGWAGSVESFLSTPAERWLDAVSSHHHSLWGVRPSQSQVEAWRDEQATMRAALLACCTALPDVASSWRLVFEYELPLEGGRRPDVIVLAGRTLVVIEFKSKAIPAQADLDQVRGYVRDLIDYHAESHGLPHQAILLLQGAAPGFGGEVDNVQLTGPDHLDHYLYAAHTDGEVDLDRWLDAALSV